MSVVHQIYKLRRDFILIGLTGRTGSGCTSVADLLQTADFRELKSEYKNLNDEVWTNDSRKNRIVYQYMSKHWHPFTCIKASDVIFFYALQKDFRTFVSEISQTSGTSKKSKTSDKGNDVSKSLEDLKEDYESLHELVIKCNNYIESENPDLSDESLQSYIDLLQKEIPQFRESLKNCLRDTVRKVMSDVLQRWGNNIRKYDDIIVSDDKIESEHAPACLARKINRFIKILRKRSKMNGGDECTHIVLDALRNPYEVLYFRERYSAFYLMSISTDEHTRRDKLVEKGFDIKAITDLDKEEENKKDFRESYQRIDIDKCIELSDIHITHDGTPYKENRKLVSQLITYLALIRHPGLVPPSPIERVMQIAYTAKLNSGCLSRQVGAAVTNSDYSVCSVGWNTVAQGQTPCSLRSLYDLYEREDSTAYSEYEKHDERFKKSLKNLHSEYCDCCTSVKVPESEEMVKLKGFRKVGLGLPLAYCFKDIHNSTTDQDKNQVHTRSLHAEENAFLQLAKYGGHGIEGGKLFTTSSCCELCGKKAYQLGIKEIYYIDSYPGITQKHIIECGNNQPKMILFHGAIGRAYSNLYNPFLPLKDEIEALSGVDVKSVCKKTNDELKVKE